MSVRSLRYNTIEQHFAKGVTASTDRDALAFLEAAQIYNTNQQRVIVNLVRSLKRVGLWSKMKAIYPFVGGTASSHKWNLKDPRDVDAAFRLTFSGGWTHSSTGAKPNGTTGYADTFLNLSTAVGQDNVCFSIYSRTNNTSDKRDLGCGEYISALSYSYTSMELATGGNKHYYRINAKVGKVMTSNLVNTLGLFAMNRIGATDIRFYKNGSKIDTDTESSTFGGNVNVTIAAVRLLDKSVTPNVTSYIGYNDRESAFATIGDGLTDTDATNLYNIVDLYQKRLGRAV